MSRYAIDSSVARKPRTLRELASGLERRGEGPLIVPALVHTEMCFHLRRRLGDRFDGAAVTNALDGVAIVEPFDREAAERGAEKLAGWHGSDEDWLIAKRAACAHALAVDAPADSARRCPATVDWYVACHAAAQGWVIITDDDGPEWRHVERIRSSELLEQLRAT